MIAIVSLTRNGTELNLKLCKCLNAYGYTLEKYCIEGLEGFTNIRDVVRLVFTHYDALVFIGACGIAVRSIAPYIKNKLTDIPVVVCDELGQYAIPILSGHLGGANLLSQRVAEATNGVAVITTATDINHKFSVDTWAKSNHLTIVEPQKIKIVSSALLDGIPVGFYSDIPMDTPQGLSTSGRVGIVVSNYVSTNPFEDTLHLLPKNLVLGIGCKRGTTMETVENVVLSTLRTLHLDIRSVARVCSIDLKADEEGILKFCQEYHLSTEFYTADELNAVRGSFSVSKFVKGVTGVDCVCERSAVRGAMHGELLQKKVSNSGVTVAVATIGKVRDREESY